jgi:hypothetical protein
MRKNGVTITTKLAPSIRKALHGAAAGTVAAWKTKNAPQGTIILNRFGS